MKIDETIKHCLELAEEEERFYLQDEVTSLRCSKSHAECAEENRAKINAVNAEIDFGRAVKREVMRRFKKKGGR